MELGYENREGLQESFDRKDNREAKKRIENTLDIEALAKKLTVFDNESLIESLARLVIELEDKITEYDTILSDDRGGRLVSLFLRNIINKKRKEADKDQAQIYFLSGGHHYSLKVKSAIENFIAKKKQTLGKTLLVTEYIASGQVIESLVNILKSEKIDFDIAAVSWDWKEWKGDDREEVLANLKYGKRGSIGLKFWNAGSSEFGGIDKGYDRKKTDDKLAHPIRSLERDPKLMKQARDDIKILSRELSKLLD